MVDDAVLAARVYNLRKALRLDQEQLATKLGMDRTALNRIENNKRFLQLREAAALAEAAGLPLDVLVGHDPIQITVTISTIH